MHQLWHECFIWPLPGLWLVNHHISLALIGQNCKFFSTLASYNWYIKSANLHMIHINTICFKKCDNWIYLYTIELETSVNCLLLHLFWQIYKSGKSVSKLSPALISVVMKTYQVSQKKISLYMLNYLLVKGHFLGHPVSPAFVSPKIIRIIKTECQN